MKRLGNVSGADPALMARMAQIHTAIGAIGLKIQAGQVNGTHMEAAELMLELIRLKDMVENFRLTAS